MEQEEELKQLKKLLSSILVSSPVVLTVFKVNRDYKEQIGEYIPFRKFGYNSLESFLGSMPDVLQVRGSGSQATVHVHVSDKVAHIDKLISRQKLPTKNKKFGEPPKRYNVTRRDINKSHNHFFVPPTVAVNYVRSFNNCSFKNNSSYSKINVPNVNHNSPESCVNQNFSESSISKVTINQIQQSSDKYSELTHLSKKQQSPRSVEIVNQVTSPEKKNVSSSDDFQHLKNKPKENDCNKEKCTETKHDNLLNSDCIYESDEESEFINNRVPQQVQANLKQLISHFDEGIFCSRLPEIYQSMFNKELDFSIYGYRCLVQMCDDLKNIFFWHQPDKGDFKLYDRTKPISRDYDKGYKLSELVQFEEQIANYRCSRESALPEDCSDIPLCFPPNVMELHESLPKQFVPDDTAKNDYIDIYVGEVYDPSKFWLILNETWEDLEMLMNHMQTYYKTCEESMKITPSFIKKGLYCVALYNNEYHRAVIIRTFPENELVKVFYVDYGTVSYASTSKLCFLHTDFVQLPQQAIRARLFGIHPIHENVHWQYEASRRFLDLVQMRSLVAEIMHVDFENSIVDVILVDTSTEEDFFINDILVAEGYARFENQAALPQHLLYKLTPLIDNIHLYPTFEEIESGNTLTFDEIYEKIKLGVTYDLIFPKYYKKSEEIKTKPETVYIRKKSKIKTPSETSLCRNRLDNLKIQDTSTETKTPLKEKIKAPPGFKELDHDSSESFDNSLNQSNQSFNLSNSFYALRSPVQYAAQPSTNLPVPQVSTQWSSNTFEFANQYQNTFYANLYQQYYLAQYLLNQSNNTADNNFYGQNYSTMPNFRTNLQYLLHNNNVEAMLYVGMAITTYNPSFTQYFNILRYNIPVPPTIRDNIILELVKCLNDQQVLDILRSCNVGLSNVILNNLQTSTTNCNGVSEIISSEKESEVVAEAELNYEIMYVIRIQNIVYAVVEQILNLLNVSISVQSLINRVNLMCPSIGIKDITLSEHKHINKHLKRLKFLSTQHDIIHLVHVTCIPRLVEIIHGKQFPFLQFCKFLKETDPSSDMWLKRNLDS